MQENPQTGHDSFNKSAQYRNRVQTCSRGRRNDRERKRTVWKVGNDMLNEFIEKILVHERDRKGSIQTTQEVEIYFNFVGRFVPPAFGEVELTPEELEEIRKREERKDRLHQNYLKRKANGKQKEYEERTKAKKKAEIEARKQAIRTEDIARGVFIPVSSLPQLGPRKGA